MSTNLFMKKGSAMKRTATRPLAFIGPSQYKKISGNQGFTLLEVLIATLVLAVGLLGISGLQVTGLRSNASSLMRTQATVLASDIADRIRANNDGFTAGDYNQAVATTYADCESTTGCTPLEMAKNDISVWGTNISRALPAGVGVVCIDSTPVDGASSTAPACDGVGSSYAIKIWWQDNRTAVLKRFVVTYL